MAIWGKWSIAALLLLYLIKVLNVNTKNSFFFFRSWDSGCRGPDLSTPAASPDMLVPWLTEPEGVVGRVEIA